MAKHWAPMPPSKSIGAVPRLRVRPSVPAAVHPYGPRLLSVRNGPYRQGHTDADCKIIALPHPPINENILLK